MLTLHLRNQKKKRKLETSWGILLREINPKNENNKREKDVHSSSDWDVLAGWDVLVEQGCACQCQRTTNLLLGDSLVGGIPGRVF